MLVGFVARIISEAEVHVYFLSFLETGEVLSALGNFQKGVSNGKMGGSVCVLRDVFGGV